MAENGFIVIADITGYTAYLSESELEHAQEILESLINTILKQIDLPLVVSRTEGDAVICYSKGDAFIMGQTMLEMLEQIYCAFQTELEHSDRNTNCPCSACQNMHELDLKFITHHGEFGLQQLGNITELVGSDVNLTFRLCKNNIPEELGLKAYALFTQDAVDALKLGDMTALMQPYSQSYEHLGEVSGWAYDLKPVWQRSREQLRVAIGPEEAALNIETELAVPPTVAWDYVNAPEHRARYRFSDSSDVSGGHNGRLDVGVTYHCIHGDDVAAETILDWRPFDYVTVQGIGNFGRLLMHQKFTIFIEPIETGTKTIIRFSSMYHPNPILNILVKGMYMLMIKRSQEENTVQGFVELGRMIEEDRQSGRLKMMEISAAAASAPA